MQQIAEAATRGRLVLGMEGFWIRSEGHQPSLGHIADFSEAEWTAQESAAEAIDVLRQWPQTDDFAVELILTDGRDVRA